MDEKESELNIFKSLLLKIKGGVLDGLLWTGVFVLLTISNASFDLLLSVELSLIFTLGMIFIYLTNRYFIIPKLEGKTILLLCVSIPLVVIVAELMSYLLDGSMRSYFNTLQNMHMQEGSLLDIQLPAESKSFFNDYDLAENSRLALSSQWKSFILCALSLMYSFLMYYRKRTQEVELQRVLLQQEKSRMELNFLRSQINPHFLFNALNNIYSMVYTGDSHAADSVLTLSELLRYVTYESKESRIPLSDEISYLNNYIEFQCFSYEGEVDVAFSKKIEGEPMIAPMLLQPFIENAFKYSGIGQCKDAFVHVELQADSSRIRFNVVNSIAENLQKNKGKQGIGIDNVRKRLELMYSGCCELSTAERNGEFEVKLNIILKEK